MVPLGLTPQTPFTTLSPHPLSPSPPSGEGGRREGFACHVERAVRRCDSPHNTSVSNSLAVGPIADIFSAARSQLPALERRETGCWVVVAQPAVPQSWVPVGRQPG